MPKNNLDVDLRYNFRKQLVGRVKNEPTRFTASDSADRDSEKEISYRHSFRKQFLANIEKGPGKTETQPESKNSARRCADCQVTLNDKTGRDDTRTKLLTNVQVNPYDQVSRAQSSARASADCHANLNYRTCSDRDETRSTKLLNSVAVNPHKPQVSRAQNSTERYKEKVLRAKEKLQECEAKYTQQSQRASTLNGGDAAHLLTDRTCTPCNCCHRRTCNQSSHLLGTKQETPAKPSPERFSDSTNATSDSVITALHIGSDDDGGTSSSTTPSRPSVREIRKIMTSRCKLEDIIIKSLKNMGREDEQPERKDQSPAKHRRDTPSRLIKASPQEIPSRRGTPQSLDELPALCSPQSLVEVPILDSSLTLQELPRLPTAPQSRTPVTPRNKRVAAGFEAISRMLTPTTTATNTNKLQKMYANAKSGKQSPPRIKSAPCYGKSRRYDTKPVTKPPLTKPPLNPENFQCHPKLIPTQNRAPTGARDNFSICIDEAVHAKLITPMIRKLQKMHFRTMRAELTVMEELDALPRQMAEAYKAQFQKMRNP